jgi:HSP20 family protein
MALTRWTPWQGLFDMQRDMDLLTKRFFGNPDWPTVRKGWVPAVDVFHRDKDLVIRAELPGIDPEKDVEISLDQNVLTIRGERRYEERSSSNGGSRFESGFGSFSRSILLPDGVKEDDIQATYENGILEVVVPGMLELTEPKRISIAVNSGRQALTTGGEKQS